MAFYGIFSKWTEQGYKHLKDSPARIDNFKQAARNAGGEVKQVFVVMGGDFDTISLVSAPNDEAIAKIALSLCALGNVSTKTLRLFNEEEAKKLLTTLP